MGIAADYMVGLYRIVLAIYVIVTHASSTGAGDGFSLGGGVAVFAFYTLSGYLITQTLDTNYSGITGTLYFFANRVLRIYPTYWTCLLVALAIVWTLGSTASVLNPALSMPVGWAWIPNIAIFGLIDSPQRIFPPAWSLNIEMVYYILMGLALSRSRAAVLTWLVASVLLLLHGLARGLEWYLLYFSFVYPSLCFALGSAVSKYRKPLTDLLPAGLAPWLFGCGLAYPILPFAIVQLGGDMSRGILPIAVLYASPFLASAVILALKHLGRPAWWPVSIDRVVGDTAYPSFLLHWPIIAALATWVLDRPVRGLPLVALSVPATLVLSLLVVLLIDVQTRRFRAVLRRQSRSGSQA